MATLWGSARPCCLPQNFLLLTQGLLCDSPAKTIYWLANVVQINILCFYSLGRVFSLFSHPLYSEVAELTASSSVMSHVSPRVEIQGMRGCGYRIIWNSDCRRGQRIGSDSFIFKVFLIIMYRYTTLFF